MFDETECHLHYQIKRNILLFFSIRYEKSVNTSLFQKKSLPFGLSTFLVKITAIGITIAAMMKPTTIKEKIIVSNFLSSIVELLKYQIFFFIIRKQKMHTLFLMGWLIHFSY
jgi:hypothetical protein